MVRGTAGWRKALGGATGKPEDFFCIFPIHINEIEPMTDGARLRDDDQVSLGTERHVALGPRDVLGNKFLQAVEEAYSRKGATGLLQMRTKATKAEQ